MIARTLATLAAASLLGSASMAAAAPSAAPLSLANAPVTARAGADLQDGSQLRGPGMWIVGGIALALVVWGAIELLGDNDEAFPNSP